MEIVQLERKQATERKALGLKTPSPVQPKAGVYIFHSVKPHALCLLRLNNFPEFTQILLKYRKGDSKNSTQFF